MGTKVKRQYVDGEKNKYQLYERKKTVQLVLKNQTENAVIWG